MSIGSDYSHQISVFTDSVGGTDDTGAYPRDICGPKTMTLSEAYLDVAEVGTDYLNIDFMSGYGATRGTATITYTVSFEKYTDG